MFGRDIKRGKQVLVGSEEKITAKEKVVTTTNLSAQNWIVAKLKGYIDPNPNVTYEEARERMKLMNTLISEKRVEDLISSGAVSQPKVIQVKEVDVLNIFAIL